VQEYRPRRHCGISAKRLESCYHGEVVLRSGAFLARGTPMIVVHATVQTGRARARVSRGEHPGVGRRTKGKHNGGDDGGDQSCGPATDART
jgi:hypothetical protein